MIDLVSVTQALLVAEHLSFSRAAQVLGVQQSAVSRRVRALEDKLGVSLFERDSTRVRLTEAGRRFLERTRPALAEIDHAMKAAASAGRGAEGGSESEFWPRSPAVFCATCSAAIAGATLRSPWKSLKARQVNILHGSRSASSMSRSSQGRQRRHTAIALSCGRRGSSPLCRLRPAADTAF
jgi:hypothetical protein